MSKLKSTPIKYTSRDFDSIKADLLSHAKRYYSDQWKDFSQSTINSLLIDSVAYVGDVLSYYLDYQANESFLTTAIEYNNVRNHARALGYKYAGTPSSYGTLSMFVLVPANSDGTAPDLNYLPTIKQGSTFTSTTGGTYVLDEDVRFDDPDSEIVAARFDSTTGATTFFAVKAHGQISSGVYQRITVDLSDSEFKKFRKINIGASNITDIISVVDSDGNKYYEVENLAQEVVFEETTNPTAASDGVRSILKPFIAARRFVMEQDDTGTYLQFGFGSESKETDGLADPSQVAIKMHGKRSITKMSFDPTKLLGTTKLGIAPAETVLTIVVKSNFEQNINAGVNTVLTIGDVNFGFDNIQSLASLSVSNVVASLEVTNEEPITGDSSDITTEELKVRAKTYYSMQNRAVTKQDYEGMMYNMPKKFGMIKRVNVVNDPSATNRRMAIYVISEDDEGKLTTTNSRIKKNLQNWIMQYKGLNDVIDIYDAYIANFGVNYKVVVDERFAKFDIIGRCNNALIDYFSNQLYIGEPVYITRLYSILGKVEGVADVKKVNINQKIGSTYAPTNIDFGEILSLDGSYLKTPRNVIMELKYPRLDIQGTLIR
tara:strand:- start:364 stop:2166 length:1803 start_codon:yes stop_codon:yes gene_type:complete